jgi:hypothetical protein
MAKHKKHEKQHSTIKEHQHVGKTLVPPLLQIKGLHLASWINDRLPEMVWVGLLLRSLPRVPVLNALRDMGDIIHKIGPEASNLTLSGLTSTAPSRENILPFLCRSERWRRALAPLLAFDNLPGRAVWASYLPVPEPTQAWSDLALAVASMLGHQSEVATDARWVRIMGQIAAGLVHLPHDAQISSFMDLTAYPHAGDLRAIRPLIRSMEGAFAGAEPKTAWPAEFWRASMNLTSCFPIPTRADTNIPPPIVTVGRVSEIYDAIVVRCNATRVTTAVDPKHDGVFSIALYATAITLELMHIGQATTIMSRLALRTLLEATITLRFLESQNTVELWQAFRTYGAGQAKLAFLKLDDTDRKPTSVRSSVLEDLANEDAWLEFVSVDLGHWAKKDLRRMSEDAGLKDLYDRFYPWTSAYAHSQWHGTRDIVFDTCGNALHRLHRIPRSSPRSVPDAIADAAALLDLILESVDRQFPSASPLPRAQERGS